MSQTNPIPEGYHERVTNKISGYADWRTPGLKIIRLRFLSDPGFPYWDVSYCHGQLPNGDYVDVGLPFHQLLKHGHKINDQIRNYAVREGVDYRALNILNRISTFN